jgi:hypothetical protein
MNLSAQRALMLHIVCKVNDTFMVQFDSIKYMYDDILFCSLLVTCMYCLFIYSYFLFIHYDKFLILSHFLRLALQLLGWRVLRSD